VQAIINAIGALCLNQIGQDQLASKPTIIPSIFSIFTSERHLKVLSEKENAAIIGSAVDELIRHHPLLKDSVFAAIAAVFERIEELGNAFVEEKDTESLYRLVLVGKAEPDSKMEVVESADLISQTGTPVQGIEANDIVSEGDQGKQEAIENVVVAYVDVMARVSCVVGYFARHVHLTRIEQFLEGLFQHTPHCRDFVTKTDGLDRLGRIVTLPCIPYNYASSPGSDALVQVLRAMTDVAPTQTISKVLGQVRASLDETREFWGTMDSKSKLLCYVDISSEFKFVYTFFVLNRKFSADEQLLEGNLKFRKLIALHTRVTLMADIFSSSTYTHGRSSLSLLSGLTGSDASDILPDIGALHRACIWENIVLKSALSARGVNISRSAGVASDGISLAGQATDVSNEAEVGSALPESEQSLGEGKSKEGVKKDGPQERNAKALKHIATQIPTSLTPFFQGMPGGSNPLPCT
jgi:E3 ubiquitin-protein ligase HUWE1